MFAACQPASAQGIIYGSPQQPTYYSAGVVDSETDIDINNDGVPDFAIISTSGFSAEIAPLGSNSIVAIPEPSPDLGYFAAALSNGTTVDSSLTPVLNAEWYNRTTDEFGSVVIGSQAGIDNQLVVLGYFAGLPSAYVGFDLVDDGLNYYGWIQLSNPLNIIAGQAVDWAYESAPNTPIIAGAVPEPSTLAFLSLGGLLILASRRRP
jgi:hypothetical protein